MRSSRGSIGPIGIWLLLWPVLWALWLSSEGRPDPHVFIVFVLGVVLTRSAGCAINDFADRNFDRHVAAHARPPARHGPGRSDRSAGAVRGLGLIALGLALTLNPLTQLLTLIGARARGHVSVLEALLPAAAVLSRRRVHLVGADGLRGADRNDVPRLAWVLFLAGRAVDDGLRHDVRDGGSRGRPQARHPLERDPVRRCGPLHRRHHAADEPARAVARGPRAEAGTVVRHRARGRGDLRAVRAVADPRAQAGALLSRIPQQQLLRHVGVHRHRARISLQTQ